MNAETRTFRARLWAAFALFAALTLGLLGLLQTVLLQACYEFMVIRNTQKAAKTAAAQPDGPQEALLDRLAQENGLLIFLTDPQGGIVYATDEHHGVYTQQPEQRDDAVDNPYLQGEETLGFQMGRQHYLSLPAGFDAFLDALCEAGEELVGLRSGNGDSYVCGLRLETQEGERILYISAALEPVGATVQIIRTQLLLVSILALVTAWALAWLLARRFSAPVGALAGQAKRLADGQFDRAGVTGFCRELDALAGSLEQAAGDITRARSCQQEFIANVSHDLRTPLTMIRGYAEMVRDISWQDAQRREEDLDVIIRESERLTGLVNDLLDVSGMRAGKMTLSMERLCLSALVEQTVGQFAALCTQSGCRIDAQIAPELFVRGDAMQLRRVLYNLIDNALVHTGEDGLIGVTLLAREGRARVEIRDHGPGIAPELLPHIWERYVKAPRQARGSGGSGLGLAICREVITLHAGQCGAESGEGALFWFELGLEP